MTSVLDAIKPQTTYAGEASDGEVARSFAAELPQIVCDLPSRIRVTREEVALISAFLGEAIHQILNSEPALKAIQGNLTACDSAHPVQPNPATKKRNKRDADSS